MKAIMRDKAELKDSGIEWIGLLPANWSYCKIKNMTTEPETIFTDGDWINGPDVAEEGIRYLTTGNIGQGNFKEQGNGFVTEKTFEELNCTAVYPGDLVISRLNSPVGRACIIPNTYPKYVVAVDNVILRPDLKYLRKFLMYCMSSDRYSEFTQLLARGTTMQRISRTQLGNIFLPVTTVDEQQVIVTYLDDRCSKIDTIIAEAKASIEEYKDLKQAVITQAVTLGIKKNRPLKDTNILWIGKTPFEWQVAELKFFASIKSGITLGQKYPAGAKLVEMPYLRVANVQGEYVDLSDVKTIQVLPEEVDKYRLEAGVVLMTEGGDRDKLGRGCVWHGEITPCLHQNHIFALTTKSDKLLPEYFSHVTTSEVARCYFDYTAKKTTNLANTNSSTIMNFRLPIPPLEEQREIVQYLDKRIKTLNDMISEKQSLIEDLEFYKKSLIYEVVTGKRKVVE